MNKIVQGVTDRIAHRSTATRRRYLAQIVAAAYQARQLSRNVIVVVRHNGPAANGMPELHMLMPILGTIQCAGFKVALLTDGRLSGASGKIPSALHITPEASKDGPLARLRDGDIITLDAIDGKLDTEADLSLRPLEQPGLHSVQVQQGYGRELFALFRQYVSRAEHGATLFKLD